jgi:NAD(P)-dependent dehydrogenase (short-subunit alcohol dehydrogenase family)
MSSSTPVAPESLGVHGRRRFADRTVVITGAATGIGRVITTTFLSEGANVAACDVEVSALGALADELSPSASRRLSTMHCDVSDRAAVTRMADGVIDGFGRIDVLVNNAGVSSMSPFLELSEHEWDRVMAVNAKGAFLCSQAVLPAMMAQGQGAIVNLSSQAGRRGERYIAHYCAAKAAVIGLTRALALEAAPVVRVNAVCPGTIRTEMVASSYRQQAEILNVDSAALLREAEDQIPLRRFQQPSDIANAIAFLSSDDAREITGQALNVSGGVIMD